MKIFKIYIFIVAFCATIMSWASMIRGDDDSSRNSWSSRTGSGGGSYGGGSGGGGHK